MAIRYFFRCWFCKFPLRPANVYLIVCSNCGAAGNKDHFSAVERKVA